MTFIILSLSRSNSFPQLRNSRKQERGENEALKGQNAAQSVLTEAIAPVENGSVLQCGERNVAASLGKCNCMYEESLQGQDRRNGLSLR